MGPSFGMPMSVCIARVQEREGEQSVDSGALEQLWHSFTDIGKLEANVFDLDGKSMDEVTATLARGLEDGRLLI
jgi:hypothetical protein